jgi:quinone-modifying oxidoreductase, subunit QmoC
MAEPRVLEPDLDFIRQIRASGGDAVKQCYQCATCATVCKLSPDNSPFPRKEMGMAQWGQKEDLARDGDIWLCHDCTDCSDECPRGARPSDVMAALRQQAVAYYAWPKHLAKLCKTPQGLPLLMLVPLVFYAAIFLLRNLFAHESHVAEGEIEFATAFPHLAIEILFFGVSAFLMFVFVRGGIAFWRNLVRAHPLPEGVTFGKVLGAFPGTMIEILGHGRFKTCKTEGPRALGHQIMLIGFLMLTVVGTVIGIGAMTGLVTTPLDLLDPMKIFANLGAALAMVGSIMLLMGRVGRREKINKGTWFDWYLVLLLNFVLATGILTELSRLSGIAVLAFTIYVIHLVGVYCLLTYIPFSKLAHLLYRTLAMHHGRLTGRIPPGDPLEAAPI